jgi:hypothetical protein
MVNNDIERMRRSLNEHDRTGDTRCVIPYITRVARALSTHPHY